MAEIPVTRKSSVPWLWMLLAAILAALIIWWIAAEADDVETAIDETATSEAVRPDRQANSEALPMTLAAIVAQPQSYIGREFSGEAGVAGPLTDRGFWIESDGARMFALIIDQPKEFPLDINAGQQLRINGGTIREGGAVFDVEGAALKENTLEVLQNQNVFLLVDESRIEILSRS